MPAVIIRQSANFTLTSYHNGLSYSLNNTAQAKSVYLQGEDAEEFRTELSLLEKLKPEEDTEIILAALYARYEEVATQN
jgi:hypothetical protein